MLLRPRRNIYKSSHKKRLNKPFLPNKKLVYTNYKLIYGQVGLKNLNYTLMLHNKHVFKLKIFLKKSTRKSSITNRQLWLNIFPQIPITKKVIGSRMGKGKGKSSNWAAKVPSMSIFIELKNLRYGRAKYFMEQVSYKLPGKHTLCFRFQNIYVPIISFSGKKIMYDRLY